MKRPLIVAPDHWRSLVDALIPSFGEQEVASFLGGKPSYNLYDAFLTAQKERQSFRELLEFTQVGSIDVAKALRAVDAPSELREILDALPMQLQVAYALKRTIHLAHEQQPFSMLITTCTDDPIGRSALEAGKELGVPVVYVHHGCHAVKPEDAWYCREPLPDLVLCPGERDRQWWRRCAPEARVEVTGHPLWDVYANLPFRPRAPGTLPVVLWAAESGANPCQTPAIWRSQQVPELAWQAFIRVVGQLEQKVEVILKVRRGEDQELVRRWMQELGEGLGKTQHLLTLSQEDPPDVLPRSDIVICQDSNIGVEALCLGLPVISFTRDGGGLFEHGLGAFVIDEEREDRLLELLGALAVTPLQGRGDVERDATYYNRGMDGLGMERTVAQIVELARDREAVAQAV